MNRDDIIRMARACFDVHTDSRGRETFSGDHFCVEELVALVTKAEREACVKVCDEIADLWTNACAISACGYCATLISNRGQA